MTLLGGAIGLFMVLGVLAGLLIIGLSLAIYPPAAAFLLALMAWLVWQWFRSKRITAARAESIGAERARQIRRNAHRPRRPATDDGFDPSLPSSLD